MQRREFLATSALLGLSTSLNSKDIDKTEPKIWLVLDEVLEILFPKTSTMPSSKEFGAIKYFQEVMFHESFPKEDKEFILTGTKDFLDTFSNFLEVNKEKKKLFVKNANESEYGSDWISKVVYYGLEAMLSDPIYGGNKDEIAWKSLNHETGRPQPKRKYARVV